MTEKMDLRGKTKQDVIDFFNKVADEQLKAFCKNHMELGKLNYNTIDEFIDNMHDTPNDFDLLKPVNQLELNDLPDDISLGDGKKLLQQNVEARNLYDMYKNYDVNSIILSKLLEEFVRQSFPERNLTDKQINALINRAYEDGSGDWIEVLSYLDDYINMVKEFLG